MDERQYGVKKIGLLCIVLDREGNMRRRIGPFPFLELEVAELMIAMLAPEIVGYDLDIAVQAGLYCAVGRTAPQLM